MIIAALLLLSLLVAFARGGNISALATVRVRYLWLFFIPFILQAMVFSPLRVLIPIPTVLDIPIYIASMLIPIVTLVLNRHLPGVIWIAAGLGLNLLVISLNGGFMPVSSAAREFAGMPPIVERNNNVILMSPDTILPWLGDVIPLPAWVPDSNVFSVGDLFILLGGMVFIQRVLVAPRRSAAPE